MAIGDTPEPVRDGRVFRSNIIFFVLSREGNIESIFAFFAIGAPYFFA